MSRFSSTQGRAAGRLSALAAALCFLHCSSGKRDFDYIPTGGAGGTVHAGGAGGSAQAGGAAHSGVSGVSDPGGSQGNATSAGEAGEGGEAGAISSASCAPACDHGTCRVSGSATQCRCDPGFSGPSCATNIDECAAQPCQNAATCTDGVNDYACTCLPSFAGKDCELPRFEQIGTIGTSLAVGASADVSVVVGDAAFTGESCAAVQSGANGGAGGANGGTGGGAGAGGSGQLVSCGYRWSHATGIRPLPTLDGDTLSSPAAVSADGSVVVGYSQSSTRRVAVRWVGNGAAQSLGMPAGDDTSLAFTVSSDGKAVLVRSSGPNAVNHYSRWSAQQGLVSLGTFEDNQPLVAGAINSDGTTIVGQVNVAATGKRIGILWVEGNSPQLQKLQPLNGDAESYAVALSSDGKVVVGSSVPPSGDPHLVRWLNGGAAEALDPSGNATRLNGVSADGSVIFGSKLATSGVAFSWNSVSHLSLLPTIPDPPLYAGPGVATPNGGVLGGGCANPIEPMLWKNNQITSVRAVLTSAGVDLSGARFFPLQADMLLVGISADGHTIAGRGVTRTGSQSDLRAWVARLP